MNELVAQVHESVGNETEARILEKQHEDVLAKPLDLLHQWDVVAIACDQECSIVVIEESVSQHVLRERNVHALGPTGRLILLEHLRVELQCAKAFSHGEKLKL